MPFGTRRRMADVHGNEIDAYLDALEEPKRSTLARLRDTIMAIVPDAEQCISYGMPAFRLRGKTVAGFAACRLRSGERSRLAPGSPPHERTFRENAGALRRGLDRGVMAILENHQSCSSFATRLRKQTKGRGRPS